VSDPTISAIDRFFDAVDKGVDAADRILNRSKHADDELKAAGRRSRRAIIDAMPVEKPTTKVAPAPAAACSRPPSPTCGPATATGTGIVRKSHFYILETQDNHTGATIYVVTDGCNARTSCSTREFANKILQALEGKS